MTVSPDCERDRVRAYRADIDGLRALAVLSVILHHYLVPGFSGGFVGVDVFFVISGFLIAAHIKNDIKACRFSLLEFYERRIRRILPALFLMYALFLMLVSWIYLRRDLHSEARLAAYVIPFLANYGFYQNVGSYSGELAAHIALLHTWSLAVEEQFYLFFPLLMIGIARFLRGRYLMVLWPTALMSLILCVVVTLVRPEAAFYLTPFRAWELLAGALLAVGKFSFSGGARMRAGVALLGLLLIVGADLLLRPNIPYPGGWPLIPCAGALAIIYASSDRSTVVGRVLDNAVMTRIGLWSYSLYLFHWPLLVLAEYYAYDPLSVSQRCILLTVVFVVGALSWRYMEQPFRGPRAILSRPAIYGVAAVSGFVLILTTFFLHRVSDQRYYTARERALFAGNTVDQIRCRDTSPEDVGRGLPCKLGDKGTPVETILWGDSHALAMLPAVDAAYARHHESAIFAQRSGCPPLLGVQIRNFSSAEPSWFRTWIDAHEAGDSEPCKRHVEAVLNWISQNHVGTVMLAAHWIAYAEDKHSRRLTDAQNPENLSMADNAAVFERGLDRLLAALQGLRVRVFLMDDAPQSLVDVPYALGAAKRLHLNREFRISRVAYDVQQHSATEIFERLQKRYEFRIIKPQDLLCAGGTCSIARDDTPLYSDDEHLSELGAMTAEPALEAIWDTRSEPSS
ncbi:MAG: acyltransferase [Pseudomonadota bacterium]|nr:acyltransferase [Pseudomonadota bacterium]